MKRYLIHPFLLLSMLLSLSSCHFLETEQIGKSDIAGYFSELDAYEPAMFGVYSLLYDFYDGQFLPYTASAGDEIILSATSSSWIPYRDFTNDSSDESGAIGLLWKRGYNIISNCNEILHYAPSLRAAYPRQTDEVDAVAAQAYFVRALIHFDLCRCYGQNYSFTSDASHLGVPVIRRILGLQETPSRDKVSAVYSAVREDLLSALSLFPSGYDKSQYFASPLACKALLARLALYRGDDAEAIKYANEVISVRDLVPRDQYVDMFRTTYPDRAKDESLFRLDGYKQSQASFKFYSWENPQARPSSRVKELLPDGTDIRNALLSRGVSYPNIVCKYDCRMDALPVDDRHYAPVLLRSSELYLIRAEARLRGGDTTGTEADLKALEARALGVAPSAVSLVWSSREDLMDLIEKERIKELCFEGHRFFDIARWHHGMKRPADCLDLVGELSYPDYRYVLPIPQKELESNPAIINNPTSNLP